MATAAAPALAKRRGNYGIDAPRVLMMLWLSSIVLLVLGAVFLSQPEWLALGLIALYWSVWMLGAAISYLFTTRRGKFLVWAEILEQLNLKGDEKILDLGCGRGAVLFMVAQLLDRGGTAVGVDLWSTADQSGNSLAAAQKNAEAEGVQDRVELHTADMRDLPFEDHTFNLVLSSLAIHNIPERTGRLLAIDEAVRVLKPDGKLLIADFRGTADYARRLEQLAMQDVSTKSLGPRFWYGGPWTATRLVRARKAST
jgi:SAM-dependent methyltransferase